MQYIKGLDAFDGRNQTAVTLGKFDGLHRGHQKLLNRIMNMRRRKIATVSFVPLIWTETV